MRLMASPSSAARSRLKITAQAIAASPMLNRRGAGDIASSTASPIAAATSRPIMTSVSTW